MPLTTKGKKILANMKKQYGDKKGEEVFYSSEKAGTITGVHNPDKKHNPRKKLEKKVQKKLNRMYK